MNSNFGKKLFLAVSILSLGLPMAARADDGAGDKDKDKTTTDVAKSQVTNGSCTNTNGLGVKNLPGDPVTLKDDGTSLTGTNAH